MNIMIFDDNRFHQDMAKRQLGQHHTLTIFGDVSEALRALSHNDQCFDAVLTDLMVPTFPQDLMRVDEQMPVGTSIALLALAKGIKKVAIVTDANHHDHPGIRATDNLCNIDMIGESRFVCLHDAKSCYDRDTLEVIEKKYLYSDEGEKKYPQILNKDETRVLGWKGIVMGKRWDRALERLLEELT